MAARKHPVAPAVVDPIVVVEVVGKNIVRVVAVVTSVGIGRHLGPTVGVVAAEVGRNPEPVVVLAG